MLMRMISIILIVAAAVGCGRPEETSVDSSKLHFITFGPGISGLVSKVKNKTLTACLSGHTSANRSSWERNIQSSILKWIEPMREMTNVPLADEVRVIDGRGNCDTDIVIAPNTHSNTSISSYPVVRMSAEGYFAGYNVLLHEFGHAFALSDTYQGGQSGNCQPGQPQALMCNTSFKDLQADDKSGVQAVFKRTFPNEVPNSGGSIPTVLNVKITLALGNKISDDKYEVFAGISGIDAQKAESVSYCLSNCEQVDSWTKIKKSQDKTDSAIFAAGSHELIEDVVFQIRVEAGQRQKKSKFAFDRLN
jgi:hypothetical protein